MKNFYFTQKLIRTFFKAGLLFLTILFHNMSADCQIVPNEGMVECFLGGNGGVFQDIGGAANYPDCDCVSTTTICAPDGSAITVDFTTYEVNGAFDWLVILDTNNSIGEVYPGGTQLFNNSDGVGDGGAENYGVGAELGVNTFATMPTTTFTATNPSGCLTFVFRSSAVVSNPGWNANITTSTNEVHPGDNIDCQANLDCLAPTGISIDDIDGINVDISWLPSGTADMFLVEYGPSGFFPGTGTEFSTPNTSTTLSGLNENTSYDFYISIACTNGDTSALIGPFTFLTEKLIDVGIVAILAPQTQCGLSTNEVVEVTIKNFGANPQSLIPFKYSVNNVSAGVTIPTDGFFTGVISQDSTVTIEFETTFDMSEPGEYTILAWTCLDGDSDEFNDTTSYTLTNIPIVTTFPYFTDFEAWDGGWKLDTENSTNPSWAYGNPNGPDISTAASGVNAWVTNLNGNYNNSELSYFVSPCYDFSVLTEDPLISFNLYFETETNWDGGWLEGSTDGGMTWTKIGDLGTGYNWYNINNTFQQLGPVWAGNSQGWIYAEHELTGFAGQSDSRFRFAFDSDGSVNSYDGIGIDNILIFPYYSDDLAALSAGHTTLSECGDEEDMVTLEIYNSGSDGQFGFDVSYQVNGGDIVTENVGALVINPGLTGSYTFTQPFDSKMFGTTFEIKAWTDLSTELNFYNDTTTFEFTTVVPKPLPLVEDFESMAIPTGWTSTDFVSNAHNNVSYVSAVNLYSGNQDFELTSTNIGPINFGDSLTFDYRYTNWSAGTVATILGGGDSLEVQISPDCGDTFTTVFTINSSNHTPVVPMTNRKVDLDQFGGEVIQIRFVGHWGSGDYWLDIDNINIIGCPQSLALEIQTIYETAAGAADGAIMINPTQGQEPYEFTWDDPNAPDNLEAGTYTVTVTDANGCIEIQTIEVGACPASLGLTAEVTPVSIEGESDGKITIIPGSGEGPYIYEWDTGDSTAVVANLPVGAYTVTVIDVHGCSDELLVMVDLFVDTDELTLITDISLAPNPTSGTSTLKIELSEVADIQVELINVVGQVLLSRASENTRSASYRLDLNDLAAGIYFVRIRVNDQLFIEKLLRAR